MSESNRDPRYADGFTANFMCTILLIVPMFAGFASMAIEDSQLDEHWSLAIALHLVIIGIQILFFNTSRSACKCADISRRFILWRNLSFVGGHAVVTLFHIFPAANEILGLIWGVIFAVSIWYVHRIWNRELEGKIPL